MDPAIRGATADDYPAILPLTEEILEQHATALPGVFQTLPCPLPEPYFRALLNDRSYNVYVAEGDKRIVGLAILTVRPSLDVPMLVPQMTATIENLVVTRAFRGQGVGKALVQACVARAKEKRAALLDLLVWEFNTEAIAFYERLGMKTLNRKMSLLLPDEL